jgi:hypothetical protein
LPSSLLLLVPPYLPKKLTLNHSVLSKITVVTRTLIITTTTTTTIIISENVNLITHRIICNG